MVASAKTQHPAEKQTDLIWHWLEEVPDPEIPAVSVVDLGIVRDVRKNSNGHVEIEITPTYSGCPAVAVIRLDIETTLLERGLEDFSVNTQIAPAWTTDWISAKGREKLKAYGIAPPEGVVGCAGSLVNDRVVQCPRCNSENTECVSHFGSTPCKASYRCCDCLEPFDYFKPF